MIKTIVETKGLLFDGAFGTYFTSQHPDFPFSCELANLKQPAWVLEIHRQYIQAGAKAIKTNTFCSDAQSLQCEEEEAQELLRQGYRIAKEAALHQNVAVFADIGFIIERKDRDVFLEYKRIVDMFLAEGATNFLFETLHNDIGIKEISAYIKERVQESYIIVSFAIGADGYTRQGVSGRKLYEEALQNEHIDATGFNCVCGPHHLLAFLKTLPIHEKPISIMPNAGYPTILNNRTFYADTSSYFATELHAIRASGASIVGGCCGTTPRYIEKIARTWNQDGENETASSSLPPSFAKTSKSNALHEALSSDKKIIAVELDPPSNCDIQKFMENAQRLQMAGVDTITIADCPIARACVDSSLLAAKVKRELDMEVIPHMTCRDRNTNATKALLYGLQIEEIQNVLLVTGDPIPQGDRNEIKAVFNFNSQILASYIKDLNETLFPAPFLMYGALNINAVNFAAELNKAKRKVECGMKVFMSQPVLSKQALENLKLAKESLSAYILGGIIPVVSHRNALFMNHEVSGIDVDEHIVSLYEGTTREEAQQLAVKISNAVVDEITPYVDGYYLITPFHRVDLMEEIIAHIQAKTGEA